MENWVKIRYLAIMRCGMMVLVVNNHLQGLGELDGVLIPPKELRPHPG